MSTRLILMVRCCYLDRTRTAMRRCQSSSRRRMRRNRPGSPPSLIPLAHAWCEPLAAHGCAVVVASERLFHLSHRTHLPRPSYGSHGLTPSRATILTLPLSVANSPLTTVQWRCTASRYPLPLHSTRLHDHLCVSLRSCCTPAFSRDDCRLVVV